MFQYRAKITENGRLLLPAACRKALGVKGGDELIMHLADDELRITSAKQALRRARRLFKEHIQTNQDLVQSLIDDRHREAASE